MKTEGILSIDRFTFILDLAGIGAEARQRLHSVFEREDPAGHEAFLPALNATADDIREIRNRYK